MSLESVFRLSLIMNMIDNLTGPMAGVTSSVNGTVSKLQKANAALGNMAKTGAVMQEVGSQITGAVLSPVEATFETRRAIGELASLGVKDLGVVEVLRPMGRNDEGRLHRGSLRHQERHRDALGRGRRGVHQSRGPNGKGHKVDGRRDDVIVCHGLRHL